MDEEMLRAPDFGSRPRKCAFGIDQIGGAEGRAALLAIVAILTGSLADGAGSLDEPVGQKRLGLGVVELAHVALENKVRLAQRGPELSTQLTVGVAVRASIVVKGDVEAGEIADVLLANVGDERAFTPLFLPGPDHDGRAVRVVGTDVDAAPPAQLLKTDPDIGLNIFDEVAQVNRTVRVWKCCRDKDFRFAHSCSWTT